MLKQSAVRLANARKRIDEMLAQARARVDEILAKRPTGATNAHADRLHRLVDVADADLRDLHGDRPCVGLG